MTVEHHVVRQGECIASIACQRGLFWESLWNAPENAALRSEREDPFVLLPGDTVAIPERVRRYEEGASETRHRFRRRGALLEFRLRLLRNGEPRADEPWSLRVGAHTSTGSTDADGWLTARVPATAGDGVLSLGPDGDEVQRVTFGTLDPLTEVSGVQGRLRNLAYYRATVDGEAGDRTRDALERFEATQGREEESSQAPEEEAPDVDPALFGDADDGEPPPDSASEEASETTSDPPGDPTEELERLRDAIDEAYSQ